MPDNRKPSRRSPTWITDRLNEAKKRPEQTSISRSIRGNLVDIVIIIAGLFVASLAIWGAVILWRLFG